MSNHDVEGYIYYYILIFQTNKAHKVIYKIIYKNFHKIYKANQ